jgi:1,4-dihydroxy-2-naphthoyl-CoA synthase
MLRIGFLTELVPQEMLSARLDALSAQIAAMAPIPLFGVKAHLNRIARGELDLAAIEQAVLRSEQSRDLAEGARAWKEKRAPDFTGR